MVTIEEEVYISFEIAILLKEKGFNENTEHKIWYVIKQFSTGCHWNSCTYKVGDTTREYDGECCIPMPTLQMAMRWLRKVHNIYYDVQLLLGDKAEKYGDLQLGVYQLSSSGAYKWECWLYADTYEELYEKYIKYCLKNLI